MLYSFKFDRLIITSGQSQNLSNLDLDCIIIIRLPPPICKNIGFMPN